MKMNFYAPDSNSEKFTFKIRLNNNSYTDIVIKNVKFRCHNTDACSLNESINNYILKKKSSKNIEINYNGIPKKRTRGLLNLTYNCNGKDLGFVIEMHKDVIKNINGKN